MYVHRLWEVCDQRQHKTEYARWRWRNKQGRQHLPYCSHFKQFSVENSLTTLARAVLVFKLSFTTYNLKSLGQNRSRSISGTTDSFSSQPGAVDSDIIEFEGWFTDSGGFACWLADSGTTEADGWFAISTVIEYTGRLALSDGIQPMNPLMESDIQGFVNQLLDSAFTESVGWFNESVTGAAVLRLPPSVSLSVSPILPVVVLLSVCPSAVALELSVSMPVTALATGSHMLNSVTQFCSVFTGTMINTDFAPVWRRNMSTNEMSWSVLPSPILWARIQPRPLLVLNRSSDSIKLSYRKRIPPIYDKRKTTSAASENDVKHVN